MARTVLIADDSPTIQRMAMGILKGDGFEVETASNGVAAIKRLAILRPVVVLADVSMPGRDGYEVCNFVKKSPDLSHVPVLLVVSDMEPYDSLRATRVGADGIIKKPFEAHELISIVGKFARQYEAATTAAMPISAPMPLVSKASGDDAPAAAAANDIPTVVQNVEAEIPANVDGIAFSEPLEGDGRALSSQANPDIAESPVDSPHHDESASTVSAVEFPDLPAHEIPLEVAAPPSPADPVPTLPPAPQGESSALLVNSAAPSISQLFIGEKIEATPAPTPDSAVAGETIRDTLHEIANPARKDETAAPVAAPTESTAMEPIFVTEELADPFGSPHEHPREHPHAPVSLSTTSLDSFSLDDAVAGQARFTSELPEVVRASEGEAAVATAALAPPESTAQGGSPVAAAAEPAPEEAYSETTFSEPSREAVNSGSPVAVLTPEVVSAEAQTTETTRESVQMPVPLPAPAAQAVQTRTAALMSALEALLPQVATAKPAATLAQEEAAASDPTPETIPYESSPSGVVSEALLAKIALLNADVEEIHAKIAQTETAPEGFPQQIAPKELPREPIHLQEPAVEPPPPVGQPKDGPEDIETHPGPDQELVRCIVKRAVLKMAHPILALETVDEITQQLTEKIVAEIRLASSEPLT